MRKTILVATLGFMCVCSFDLTAQYQEISARDLESKIYLNHQQGFANFKDLYTEFTFKLEDYSKLTSSFNQLKEELIKKELCVSVEQKGDSKALVILIDRTKFTTDEFLKVFKGILETYSLYLNGYQEKTMVFSGK